MDLHTPATADNLDQFTQDDILAWATIYLPAPSAKAFTSWLDNHIGDREDEDVAIRDVLVGAYQEWIGADLPNPPAWPRAHDGRPHRAARHNQGETVDTTLHPGTYVRTPNGCGTVTEAPTRQTCYGRNEWIVRVKLDQPLMADYEVCLVDLVTVGGRPATVAPEET